MNILLADTRPLFHSPPLHQLLTALIGQHATDTGIYIGAANHDQSEFYDLACGVFNRLALQKHLHLRKNAEQALGITIEPCVIILSGGSMTPGWNYLSQPHILQWLNIQRALGSIFIGISAGAIHLSSGLNDNGMFQPYLHWTDATIAVHEEVDNWPSIKQLHKQGIAKVIAIPFNDGVIIQQQIINSLQGRSTRHVLTDGIVNQIKIPAICIDDFKP